MLSTQEGTIASPVETKVVVAEYCMTRSCSCGGLFLDHDCDVHHDQSCSDSHNRSCCCTAVVAEVVAEAVAEAVGHVTDSKTRRAH
ncbi:unnamed protein product [Arabis nemorensis]|uniref:Uncharacterized protein n=1 Tax=Arabis nemorensis TaxID=586526 RepID=A0A565BEN2_9BRAS|nr:unnamed protein product [Arabis nemorensis]